MIENILFALIMLLLLLVFKIIEANTDRKERNDTEFLEWVIRHVEWVVDDSGELDFWEFEVNIPKENCIYLKTAHELREFWEKNVKK